ncbi:MAG TPA: hypothetical protein P5556_10060 [Candidatus Gastranaerophilales bacterium]|nr:hypothetical protein [Candidatus Gastranaerophilales bacterium]HSA07512.1 hypothetical protein [Candidatus Gastranaerophilales bacterium]
MDLAYGTKVYDYKKKSIAILIKTYNLGYVDAPDATGAKVIDTNGRLYATNLDNLRTIEDIKTARLYNEITEQDFKALNIPESFLIEI